MWLPREPSVWLVRAWVNCVVGSFGSTVLRTLLLSCLLDFQIVHLSTHGCPCTTWRQCRAPLAPCITNDRHRLCVCFTWNVFTSTFIAATIRYVVWPKNAFSDCKASSVEVGRKERWRLLTRWRCDSSVPGFVGSRLQLPSCYSSFRHSVYPLEEACVTTGVGLLNWVGASCWWCMLLAVLWSNSHAAVSWMQYTVTTQQNYYSLKLIVHKFGEICYVDFVPLWNCVLLGPCRVPGYSTDESGTRFRFAGSITRIGNCILINAINKTNRKTYHWKRQNISFATRYPFN